MNADYEALVLTLWNLSALISLSVALVGLGGAFADWEYLRVRRLNGLRSIQAGANIRTQMTRATISLLFLLAGALTIMHVPYRTESVRWLLIAASCVLAVGSTLDWIDRRRMIGQLIDGDEP